MKKNILVVFGGSSSEYYVSCRSAAGVISCVDSNKYNVCKLGITMDGEWFLTDAAPSEIEDGKTWIKSSGNKRTIISPEQGKQSIVTIDENGVDEIKIDCAIPLIHGYGGEDGKLQGLFELAHIPFAGSSVAASVNSMDKGITRIFSDICGLKRPESVVAYKKDSLSEIIDNVSKAGIPFPVFVKPANAGSSVGVSKAENNNQLENAIKDAFLYDDKIMIEEGVKGKEIKVAILEKDGKAMVGALCELTVADGKINDYDTKYVNHSSVKKIPAEIDEETAEIVKKQAIDLFNYMECRGMARVDFFVDDDRNIYFNEINTIPGISRNSIYPLMLEEAGISYGDMVNYLIKSALGR